jgi:hypothetical protein
MRAQEGIGEGTFHACCIYYYDFHILKSLSLVDTFYKLWKQEMSNKTKSIMGQELKHRHCRVWAYYRVVWLTIAMSFFKLLQCPSSHNLVRISSRKQWLPLVLQNKHTYHQNSILKKRSTWPFLTWINILRHKGNYMYRLL